MSIYYCDNCGEETEHEDTCFVDHLSRDVESALAGESAALCQSCFYVTEGRAPYRVTFHLTIEVRADDDEQAQERAAYVANHMAQECILSIDPADMAATIEEIEKVRS